MFITKVFFILILTYSVTSSELNSDLKRPVFLVKSYNYNHPPLVEADKDDSEVRKVRQVKPLESEKKDDTIALEIQNEYSEIPVDVVYDSVTQQKTNKIKRRKQTRRPNPIDKERKEELKSSENHDLTPIENIESLTEKILSPSSPYSSPSPITVVPKIFTKRPPEDNPVFKKFRQREPVVKIVEESNYVYGHNGNFHYSFEGADGTKVSSEGELKSFNNDKTGEAVVGSVFYKDNEGNDFSLSYTADENGYRPQGDHLPTPPPIPPAIARALKYLATKTTPEPVTEATKNTDLL